MIDYIDGVVKRVHEKTATIVANNIGFLFHIPRTQQLTAGKKIELYTYMHWNADKGPSLYGFSDELERTTFLMIIDCPKIGPGIALSILSQIPAPQFLEIITSQNESALSAINGIGKKKAEQLVMQLKHKVSKLISTGAVKSDTQQDFVQWQNVTDVLTSLNYSRQEINGAMKFLGEKYREQNHSLDQLIRSALGFLSKGA